MARERGNVCGESGGRRSVGSRTVVSPRARAAVSGAQPAATPPSARASRGGRVRGMCGLVFWPCAPRRRRCRHRQLAARIDAVCGGEWTHRDRRAASPRIAVPSVPPRPRPCIIRRHAWPAATAAACTAATARERRGVPRNHHGAARPSAGALLIHPAAATRKGRWRNGLITPATPFPPAMRTCVHPPARRACGHRIYHHTGNGPPRQAGGACTSSSAWPLALARRGGRRLHAD